MKPAHWFAACMTAVAILSNVSAEETPKQDTFLARLDYDGAFNTYPTLTWIHPLSEQQSVCGSLVVYVDYQTMELDFGWNYSIGNLTLSPAIGVTFGQASWKLSSDTRSYMAREVVPLFTIYYRTPSIEMEGYNAAWIPTQESYQTAIWFMQNRWYLVKKWNEFGVGPHFETIFTKEGSQDMKLTQLWPGLHVVKNWARVTFQLFLGWDLMSLPLYLGSPKDRGPAWRGTVIYSF